MALNPIKSLIRVMHRDFTLHVGFFKGATEEKDIVEPPKGPDRVLLSLMCGEGSCAPVSRFKCSGKTDDLFL